MVRLRPVCPSIVRSMDVFAKHLHAPITYAEWRSVNRAHLRQRLCSEHQSEYPGRRDWRETISFEGRNSAGKMSIWKNRGEIEMRKITSLRQSSKCPCCGEWLIAPERSTYVSEEQVRNLWVCPKCGNEFETSIYPTQHVPLTPEVVDTFFPTLLVA